MNSKAKLTFLKRLALAQGQPLGRVAVSVTKICAASGIRCTQKRPGRTGSKTDKPIDTEMQTGFGF